MINIAIDGPAGSGKSTIAKIVSRKLNILYLDTGAMYRACALKAFLSGIDLNDESAVNSIVEDINIKIKYLGGVQHTFLDDADVSDKIRENSVSKGASEISRHKSVREKMVEMQRKIASECSCIMDGRDICMYVLPDAKYKFFVTASPIERAKRRRSELLSKGQNVSVDKLLTEIAERDYQDSHRENSPLKQAPDAVLLDTSEMSATEAADRIIEIVKKGGGI